MQEKCNHRCKHLNRDLVSSSNAVDRWKDERHGSDRHRTLGRHEGHVAKLEAQLRHYGTVGDGWGNKTKKTEVDLKDAQTWKSHEPQILVPLQLLIRRFESAYDCIESAED